MALNVAKQTAPVSAKVPKPAKAWASLTAAEKAYRLRQNAKTVVVAPVAVSQAVAPKPSVMAGMAATVKDNKGLIVAGLFGAVGAWLLIKYAAR